MNVTATTEIPAGVRQDVEFFIKSCENVFNVMLACELSPGEPSLEPLQASEGIHTTSVIGLQGSSNWTVTASFPSDAAESVAKRMFQLPADSEISAEETSDAMGELANMVAGGAKADLSEQRNEDISLSLPTVVTGSDYRLLQAQGAVLVTIPFDCELCSFTMKVAVVQQ